VVAKVEGGEAVGGSTTEGVTENEAGDVVEEVEVTVGENYVE
jgi:hypothetical protein